MNKDFYIQTITTSKGKYINVSDFVSYLNNLKKINPDSIAIIDYIKERLIELFVSKQDTKE